MYTCIPERLRRAMDSIYLQYGSTLVVASIQVIHPVCRLRFVSDWTRPLDILSADSECVCYLLSTKRVPGQPNPRNKSWTANSCYANWVYEEFTRLARD